ncbi:hypothetical protein CEXT_680211 [Caerostris extrusa]|uniref:Uncharacterized protein n=1 Tax=Caerostris extrusa TaxID=172846 RepID=A0AAV4XM30_CAEEX|nr:hypothetical protein CEXT_680211 [Caerostris extrusa]
MVKLAELKITHYQKFDASFVVSTDLLEDGKGPPIEHRMPEERRILSLTPSLPAAGGDTSQPIQNESLR